MSKKPSKRGRRRRLKPLFRFRKRPGARPGTIEAHADAPPTKIRAIAYSHQEIIEREITDVRQIAELLDRWLVVWINVDGLGDAQTIKGIGELFGIHPLALEDVVNVHQRAKVEPYEDHLYVVVRMPNHAHERPTEQVSLFFGDKFVLTFQETPGDCFDSVRDALRAPDSRMRKGCQADYLAYRLIDSLVDSYFPVLERLGDRLDELDESIIEAPRQEVFREVHSLKSELLLLRRAVWPMRDAIHQLAQESTPLISEATRVFWRDCYDHAIQILDLTETYREICADLRDFYLSSVSNRMNEIMKVLTIIATTFIPLSFIAGLYGMNFDPEVSKWNMPELKWPMGYPFALGLMCAVTLLMLVFFWRRGWFGRGD